MNSLYNFYLFFLMDKKYKNSTKSALSSFLLNNRAYEKSAIAAVINFSVTQQTEILQNRCQFYLITTAHEMLVKVVVIFISVSQHINSLQKLLSFHFNYYCTRKVCKRGYHFFRNSAHKLFGC